MKITFTAIAVFLLITVSCKREGRPRESHPLYGDSIVNVLPNGDSVIQDEKGNVLRTIYTPFGPNQSNTSYKDAPITQGMEQAYYIKGKLVGGAGATIILDLLNVGETIKPLYSQTVNKEELFDFEGTTSVPQMMQLRVPAGAVHFIVKPGDSIEFELDLQTVSTYKVKGSPESKQLYYIYSEILEKANDKKHAIEDEIEQTGNVDAKIRLMNERPGKVDLVDQQKFKELKAYISKIGNSYAALVAAMYLRPDEEIEYLAQLDEKFGKLYPGSALYDALHEKVKAYAPFRIGMKAPEILLETPDGKDVPLTTTRGKYVLLYFWSPNNTPSVAGLPQLKKLYDKFKGKGLEIYSVNIDTDKNLWVNTIKDQKMSWINVSDLLGSKSQAVQTYLLSNVPKIFLLDKEGRIIARDIRGSALEKKLAEIF